MKYALILLAGAAGAFAARALLVRVILMKLRSDMGRLNAGDHRPLLSGYVDDAVLHFADGPHRWSGAHRGKVAIEAFLRNFVGAGMRGDIRALWIGGPPWAMTMVVRFDDAAVGPGGEELYANRVMILAKTRWGRITEQHDFYEDTARIARFEEKLQELGIPPISVD